jgi:quercetin dioxygenase-like cupin family protein
MVSHSFVPFSIALREVITYTKPGVNHNLLVKDDKNQFSLVCLTAGTTLPEHAVSRSISIMVIEGNGNLTLEEQKISLEPGVFVYIPANAKHALFASENLAFLHT